LIPQNDGKLIEDVPENISMMTKIEEGIKSYLWLQIM